MENPSKITTYNPEIGEKLQSYPMHTFGQLEEIFKRSKEACREWRRTTREERNEVFQKLADLMGREKQDLAQLAKNEMGKPIAEGLAEIEKCISCVEYYVRHGAEHLAPMEVSTEARLSFVCFEPIGPVLAIMPWNF